MTNERIAAAAGDLNEALLIASDGSAHIPEETLRSALALLLHGTDSGEFFDSFHSLLGAPVAQYRVRADGFLPLDELCDTLTKRYPSRSARIVAADPRGSYVVNMTDHSWSDLLHAEIVEGKVVIRDAS